jgi:membrane associated rhomboid family serine protease
MLLPIRSKNPPESLPFGTLSLIFINVLIFILTADGLQISEKALAEGGLTYHNFGIERMLSSMFLHGDILHLLGNMWFLYLFGFAVEGRLRTLKFLLLYLVAGIAGDLLHHFLIGRLSPEIPLIGASGAIMGVLGAALWMFPHAKIDVFYWVGLFWRGVFTVSMWVVGLWYLGFDLLWALVGAETGIGHLAHLGGAAGGFFVAMLFRPVRDDSRASEAKATFAETKDLGLLSSAELEQMARVNPADTAVALNWMHRSIRDGRGISAECTAHFFTKLPQMLQEHEPGPIGYCIGTLAATPGSVPTRYLIDIASRLERSGDNAGALRLYDCVLRDPNAPPADQEAAWFRIGLVSESVFGNFERAAESYRQIIQKWPMSPLADQARIRLKVVEPKARVQ